MALSDYTHVDENNNLVKEGSETNTVIIECEIIFTVVFTCEFVIKILALGVYGTPDAYFSDMWNWLDFGTTYTNHIILYHTI